MGYGLVPMRDVLPEGIVEQGLIVSPARFFHPRLEPLYNVLVQSDGNPDFVAQGKNHRSPPSLKYSVPEITERSELRR